MEEQRPKKLKKLTMTRPKDQDGGREPVRSPGRRYEWFRRVEAEYIRLTKRAIGPSKTVGYPRGALSLYNPVRRVIDPKCTETISSEVLWKVGAGTTGLFIPNPRLGEPEGVEVIESNERDRDMYAVVRMHITNPSTYPCVVERMEALGKIVFYSTEMPYVREMNLEQVGHVDFDLKKRGVCYGLGQGPYDLKGLHREDYGKQVTPSCKGEKGPGKIVSKVSIGVERGDLGRFIETPLCRLLHSTREKCKRELQQGSLTRERMKKLARSSYVYKGLLDNDKYTKYNGNIVPVPLTIMPPPRPSKKARKEMTKGIDDEEDIVEFPIKPKNEWGERYQQGSDDKQAGEHVCDTQDIPTGKEGEFTMSPEEEARYEDEMNKISEDAQRGQDGAEAVKAPTDRKGVARATVADALVEFMEEIKQEVSSVQERLLGQKESQSNLDGESIEMEKKMETIDRQQSVQGKQEEPASEGNAQEYEDSEISEALPYLSVPRGTSGEAAEEELAKEGDLEEVITQMEKELRDMIIDDEKDEEKINTQREMEDNGEECEDGGQEDAMPDLTSGSDSDSGVEGEEASLL